MIYYLKSSHHTRSVKSRFLPPDYIYIYFSRSNSSNSVNYHQLSFFTTKRQTMICNQQFQKPKSKRSVKNYFDYTFPEGREYHIKHYKEYRLYQCFYSSCNSSLQLSLLLASLSTRQVIRSDATADNRIFSTIFFPQSKFI